MAKRITPELMAAILDSGYNIDYIDAATIDKIGVIPYPILVIPPTDRIPLAAYKLIERYGAMGGRVIGIGKTRIAPPPSPKSPSASPQAPITEAFCFIRSANYPPRFIAPCRRT
jgi:hypothetical protein